MSLLMDALKRAESSKLDKPRMPAGDPHPLSLEPMASEPAAGGGQPLPDLAAHLDAVDAELADSLALESDRPAPPPKAPPTKTPPAADPETRQAVRNAFAAKEAARAPRRQPFGLVLGVLGLAGLAIGVYYWHQLDTVNRRAPPPATVPSAPPVASPQAPAGPVTPPILAASGRSTAEIATETPLFPLRREQRAEPAPPIAEAPPPGMPTIRLTRGRPEVDTGLTEGHAGLQRGDLEAARREFERTLQRDPNNVDALLALAALAHRQGRPGEAEALRQRAVIANPGDTAAQAALLNGALGETDPQVAESRLKLLLSSQPDSASLNFALGNLYARQGRWSEAQPAYFNAVAADGDNPDYLFNLAVSLDHLRQPRLAAQHYRLALDAAGKRPAAFERDGVLKRLGELPAVP